jgi:hypothetical protein
MPVIEPHGPVAALPQWFDIDVCLNGGRGHIEALQMLPQAAAMIMKTSSGSATLAHAAIKRMTNRDIVCRVNPDPQSKVDCVGVASFVLEGELLDIGFYERATTAKRRDLVHSVRYAAVAPREAARFDYSHLHSFEDLIILIIHCVKLFHQAQFPGASDIRFTSCRGGALPLVISPPFAEGQLHIQPLRSLKLSGAVQTNSQVTIRAKSGESLRCTIGFSYVSGAPS